MKTTINIFATLAVVLGFAMGAMAQQTDNDVILGKAAVVAQVEVTGDVALDFKNVTPGVNKTIGLTNNVTAGTATGGETTGVYTVTKGAGTQVTLGFTLPGLLLFGTEELVIDTYTSRLRIGDVTTPTNAFSIVNLASTSTANTGGTIPFFAASEFNVDLGATVKPDGAQVAGAYEEDITLTATYN